jgi:hypothetical protein
MEHNDNKELGIRKLIYKKLRMEDSAKFPEAKKIIKKVLISSSHNLRKKISSLNQPTYIRLL